MKRRQLIKAGAGTLALGATAQATAQESYQWKLVMSWPKKFPGLATTAEWFAEEVKRVTGGRLNITIYGAGELVPAFEVFNAVSENVAEIGHGTPYYWKGKIPEAELFTSVPFGLTGMECNAWFLEAQGHELLQELYRPFGVVPLAGGNTGCQMGGWFNKEINNLTDLQGLKIRMPGIGGEVLRRVGATTVGMPGSEIFTAMQNGVIDAADWIGPWNDQAFGLYKVAKYYYYGWQEPGSFVEFLVNEKALAALPDTMQAQVRLAAQAANLRMFAQFRMQNARALVHLVEKEGVKLRFFPDEVIMALKKETAAYLAEMAGKSAMAKKVIDSLQAFRADQIRWTVNEAAILRYREMPIN